MKTEALSACHAATRCHEKPCLASRCMCCVSPWRSGQVVVLEQCVPKASCFTLQLMPCRNFLKKLFHIRVLLETKVTSGWLNYLLMYLEAAEVKVSWGCCGIGCLIAQGTLELKCSVCSQHKCAFWQRTGLWFDYLSSLVFFPPLNLLQWEDKCVSWNWEGFFSR